MSLNFKIVFKIVFILIGNYLNSQSLEIPKNIKTIIFKTSKSKGPFIHFGDLIELSFDDIDGDEKNYYYQITHFDYLWNPSKLYKSEYLEGFDDIRIKKIRNSFNTLQPYTNYILSIPNDDVKLKVSGNYSISIHLSNGKKVFEKRFSFIDNQIPIQISISKSNTINNLKTHQKIKIKLNQNKINFSNHYKPIHMLKVSNKITQTDLKNSTKYFKHSISLPIYPSLSEKNVKFICQKIIETVEN